MSDNSDFSELHSVLTSCYNEEELKTLCAQLGVSYDDLPAEGRAGKARELILALQRRGKLSDLKTCLQGRSSNASSQPPEPFSRERQPVSPEQVKRPKADKIDFFISYNRADLAWAEWIAWQLEAANYTTVVDVWDFRPGGNFVIEMQRAAEQARRTIAVLSPDYLKALYTQPEWAAAFAQDPAGEKGTLLPVRVRVCELEGLLSQIIHVNLVGLEEGAAKQTLLTGVAQGRAKPTATPGFPGPKHTTTEPPGFPGRPGEVLSPGTGPSPLPQLSLKLFKMDRKREYQDEIVFDQVEQKGGEVAFGLVLENTTGLVPAKGILIRLKIRSPRGDRPPHLSIRLSKQHERWTVLSDQVLNERPAVLSFQDSDLYCLHGHPEEWGGFALALSPSIRCTFRINYKISSIEPVTESCGALVIKTA